ncbi:MAG TPA: hypothetical protein VF092_15830 [Longimicrobium sp.]
MHERLTLTLEALRVRTFATTPAPHGETDDDDCGECTEATRCTDWTRCTRCTWPSCIATEDDGPDCLPGTVA